MKLSFSNFIILVMLLAGSSIGAGMLAMPTVAGIFGIIPSTTYLIFCALYMLVSGFLLIELMTKINIKHLSLNMFELSDLLLGKFLRKVTFALFIFLFMCLIIAYLAKGGDIILNLFPIFQTRWIASLVLSLVSFLVVLLGIYNLSRFNLVCMLALFLFYCLIIILAFDKFEPNNLSHIRWSGSYYLIPFLITAFGFQNMLPTIAKDYNLKKLELLLVTTFGVLVPLLVYFIYIFISLGVVPLKGQYGIEQIFINGQLIVEVIGNVVNNNSIALLANAFALLAIVTSLFTQLISLSGFVLSSLSLNHNNYYMNIFVSIILSIAFICSQLSLNIFMTMLEYVGLIAAMTLFGIFPGLMVLKLRYGKHDLPINQDGFTLYGGKTLIMLFIAIPILLIVANIFGLFVIKI